MNKEHLGLAFDLEGPLIDLEKKGHHAAHLKAAEAAGLKLTLEKAIEIIPHFIGGPDVAVAEDIYELGNKKLSVKEIHQLKKSVFKGWLEKLDIIPTRTGLFKFLDKIKARGIKMVIGTSTEEKKALYYLNKSGLDKYFSRDKLVVAEDVKRNKPFSDIYFKTAKIMGISPRKQLVIEDSPGGVKAGIVAGSIVIALPVYFVNQTIIALKEAGAMEVKKGWSEIDLDSLINLLS